MTDTILTSMTPRFRSYKHDLSTVMHTNEVFTPEECQNIIDTFGKDMEPGVLNTSEGNVEDGSIRECSLKWIEPTPDAFPFMDRLLRLVMHVNQRFEFEVDTFEGFQLTRYDEGHHYDWHKDIGPSIAGHRKLSISVQLTSPDEYEGGELEMWIKRDKRHLCTKDHGSAIVFPSWEMHRVLPVTKGTRWALITWASGASRFR